MSTPDHSHPEYLTRQEIEHKIDPIHERVNAIDRQLSQFRGSTEAKLQNMGEGINDIKATLGAQSSPASSGNGVAVTIKTLLWAIGIIVSLLLTVIGYAVAK